MVTDQMLLGSLLCPSHCYLGAWTEYEGLQCLSICLFIFALMKGTKEMYCFCTKIGMRIIEPWFPTSVHVGPTSAQMCTNLEKHPLVDGWYPKIPPHGKTSYSTLPTALILFLHQQDYESIYHKSLHIFLLEINRPVGPTCPSSPPKIFLLSLDSQICQFAHLNCLSLWTNHACKFGTLSFLTMTLMTGSIGR